jgi:phage/plasmid-like protein (TIGR03299 family)
MENLNLANVGLDWSVRTENVQTLQSGIIIPKKIAIIREDNNAILGDHASGYVPFQNEQLLDLLQKVSGSSGLQMHTGGYFGNGEKVYIQLKSDDLVLPNDKIKGYISGFNSFDGSTSLGFGNSSVTVSCMNTFWKGFKQVQSKVKHTANMQIRIDEILFRIDELLKEEKVFFQQINQLGNVKLSQEVKEMVIRKLFDIEREERLDSELVSTNKKNKIENFTFDMNGELAQKGDNLWGMFSSVTKYTTHSMKKTDNTENKIFGVVGKREREIWDSLVELV